MTSKTTASLEFLYQQGALSALGYAFARFVTRYAGEPLDSLLGLSAALVSETNQQGDVCLNLDVHANKPVFVQLDDTGTEAITLPKVPALPQWLLYLDSKPCVGKPGEMAPLILDGEKLYLGKFWHYENMVAQQIGNRVGLVPGLDYQVLQAGLHRLFPEQADSSEQVNWQMLATAIAVSRYFAVISGGPGTGKTTTVVKVLALLLEQDPQMRIHLAAPTGKAAARMVESIRQRKHAIPDADVRNRIPDQASTLHRLLSFNGRKFRKNRDNRLVTDCVVVDEASMIDMTLMTRLLAALPDDCRVILLGDRDQLASVEAGSVLGDITGHGIDIVYSATQLDLLNSLTGERLVQDSQRSSLPEIANCIGLLQTSYRFHASSVLGRFAQLINAGQAEQALALIRQSDSSVSWLEANDRENDRQVVMRAVEQYSGYLRCQSPATALQEFNRFRVLCAVHEGPSGDLSLNHEIEVSLQQTGLLDPGQMTADALYHGKPVMVTANDYELNLFNGDTGLAWRNDAGKLRIWFQTADGAVRDISPDTLPAWVPAWALTIHKSQGSEYDCVVLTLPQQASSPLLCRELVYTAITRARHEVLVHASETVFIAACQHEIVRSTGLGQRLGWR
ncbi:MAG: exodeoxyribonuclease V subunit alpha [Pseudomonadales bacterium]|nr:exodeoxyribonuclease V subunit alpha [Pseudomonadales bacterium]